MPTRRVGVLFCALVMLASCTTGHVPQSETVLPQRSWLPEGPPEAVILTVHGFNEYSHVMAEFGDYASAHGIAVVAYDQRGFGANTDAGFWPGDEALVRDLATQAQLVRDQFPDSPLVVLGVSMGGAVVIAAMTGDHPLPVDGVILSNPAVWGGSQLNPMYRFSLWVGSSLFPRARVTGRGLGVRASDNIAMLRDLGADPLIIKETRLDALAGLVGLMDRAEAQADQLPGPALLLGGALDEVIPPDAFDATRQRVTQADCTAVIYPNGYHMLLRDLQRMLVWDDILAWIKSEPPPSGLAEPCVDHVVARAAH